MPSGMGVGLSLPGRPAPAAPFAPQQSQSGIAGGLPFGAMGQNASMPSDLASLGSHYANAYNSALAMNSSNYTNILAGYQQTLAQQTKAQDAIAGGYTGLYNDVLGQLGDQGGVQRQQINRDYAAGIGRASQQLIDRGLGNSTVQASVNRGYEADRAMAGNQLNEQVARQYADYASRLGVAGLDYRDRANQQNTAQNDRQLGWMDSVNSPYPDAGMYSQLAMQYGMAGEAEKNRAALNRGGGRPSMPPMSGGVSGVYGNHFPKGFAGGEGGSGVQLGGGAGGGGGYGNVAGGVGSYINPGQGGGGVGGYDYGFSQPETQDYSSLIPAVGGVSQAAGNLPGYDYSSMIPAVGGFSQAAEAAPYYDQLY